MNPTLLSILISLTGISLCSGALLENYRRIAWYKKFAIACIVFVAGILSYLAIEHGIPGKASAGDQSIRWESLETGRIYYARAYIKKGEHAIAVIEHDGLLRFVDVPFAPHSAYLQVELDQKSGRKILTELTRNTNATVIPLFGKASLRIAAH